MVPEKVIYAPWLRDFVGNSKKPFVRDSEGSLRLFMSLESTMKREYGWRFTPSEAFERQVDGLTAAEVNELYWRDMARQMEAYSVLLLWRASETFAPTLDSLNARAVLPPAILSRALLELAATSIWNCNILQKTLQDVLSDSRLSAEAVVVSEEFEHLVDLMLRGTRLPNTQSYFHQKSGVGAYIRKLTQNPNAVELQSVYDHLCDLAHPNMLGNVRFVAAQEDQRSDGSFRLRLESYAESPDVDMIRENIIWALAWSTATIANAVYMNQQSVQTILGSLLEKIGKARPRAD